MCVCVYIDSVQLAVIKSGKISLFQVFIEKLQVFPLKTAKGFTKNSLVSQTHTHTYVHTETVSSGLTFHQRRLYTRGYIYTQGFMPVYGKKLHTKEALKSQTLYVK